MHQIFCWWQWFWLKNQQGLHIYFWWYEKYWAFISTEPDQNKICNPGSVLCYRKFSKGWHKNIKSWRVVFWGCKQFIWVVCCIPADLFQSFFHLLMPISKLLVEKYLQEGISKKSVQKVKTLVRGCLLTCYLETGSNLLRYINLILNHAAFEHICFSYKARVDYCYDSHNIVNLKWRFFAIT